MATFVVIKKSLWPQANEFHHFVVQGGQRMVRLVYLFIRLATLYISKA
jgi:hypothetical protein